MSLLDAFRYDGRRVVMVGGAIGMGAAAAELAQAAGADVVIMSAHRRDVGGQEVGLADAVVAALKVYPRQLLSGAMTCGMCGDSITQVSAARICGMSCSAWKREVARTYADVPETVRLRNAELSALERKIANFVEYIGEGRGSELSPRLSRQPKRRPRACARRSRGW